MKTTYKPQSISIFEEAADVLREKLGITKATDFWASLGYGQGDYSKMRKKIFKKETVSSLYQKIKKFE